MISMRVNKFYKRTGRKLDFNKKGPLGFDKSQVECYNCHKKGHFARECRLRKTQESNSRNENFNNHRRDEVKRGVQDDDQKALVV